MIIIVPLKSLQRPRRDAFVPDPYKTAVDEVYSKLRRMILNKDLVRGQKLPEVALADQLMVSRTPVREALRRLAHDGFVVIVPKNGAWVAAPSRKEVEDAYRVRAKLEGWAASMAAENMTPLFLARLDEKIRDEDDIFKKGDIEAYLEVNTSFHMIIAEASGNAVLMEYIGDVLARTFIYMVFHERYFDFATNPSLDEHRQLLAAFTKGDKDFAVGLTEAHVKRAFGDLIFE